MLQKTYRAHVLVGTCDKHGHGVRVARECERPPTKCPHPRCGGRIQYRTKG